MSVATSIDFGRRARRLRVDTLVRLRWLAIVGQSAAVLFTHYALGFNLPLVLCFAAITVSAWLNVGLRLRYGVNHRLEDGPASLLLAFDLLQLTALLYLTGGLQNPFAVLFLAPIMISAVSLSVQRTLALVALMVAAATFLVFFQYPLPWGPGTSLKLPLMYVAGIWMAIVLGAGFIAAYAFRVAEEARRLSDALTATELVLAREQHLTQLDGLAAAAAHELGTPLATITLVVKEMRKMQCADPAMADDIALLEQEAQRCRAILGKLTSLGGDTGGQWRSMSLRHLVEEVIEPSRDFGVELQTSFGGEGAEPIGLRNPGVIYGLGNLIENAVDFAKARVVVDARWTATRIRISIEDDGPGFSAEVLAKLGEPYVTTRGPDRRAKSEEGGLGLGLFIAKTLLERSGGAVTMSNNEPPGSGARVAVVWPRAVFEGLAAEGSQQPTAELETAAGMSRLA